MHVGMHRGKKRVSLAFVCRKTNQLAVAFWAKFKLKKTWAFMGESKPRASCAAGPSKVLCCLWAKNGPSLGLEKIWALGPSRQMIEIINDKIKYEKRT